MPTNRTLSQLNEAIKTEMQLDPGLISDPERKQFINDCIIDLGSISSFEKLVDIEVTDGKALLPTDFVDFIALFRGNTQIKPATTSRTTEGFISQYPNIEIRPHQTETLTLWYTYAPARLEEDSDVPDIPYGFDNAIVDYAVARAHRKNGNIGIYREYMSAYESKKAELHTRLVRFENSRVGVTINSEETSIDVHSDDIILF